MVSFRLLFFITASVLLTRCESQSNDKQQHKTKTQKDSVAAISTVVVKENKPPEKYILPQNRRYIFDSISTENAVEFFTEYGKKNPETKIKIETRLGTIIAKLYEDTPIHRASFIYLVKMGYYNTTCFYRVVPDFIVQGGNSDNLVTPAFKEQLHDYKIPAEFRKNRGHKRGCMAAARDWVNNPEKMSSPFEFYFIQATKDQSHLNFEHTVFGEIINGIEVIDKITKVAIDRYEWPEKEIPMKITVLKN
ncbi:peptidylprolyl isomerase [Flavicella marina]|uniref:peptidylprolyl isomerase n=1 Tax=Flavicella marina TaxID=1475951 RepID=UPI001264DB7D|nr:peptidylprolyl isomerase [Flavicella marina]